MSASQVTSLTASGGPPRCNAVAAISRSCISEMTVKLSDRSRIARSSGTMVIRVSASTSAKSSGTEGMLVRPAATAQHASASAMTGRYKHAGRILHDRTRVGPQTRVAAEEPDQRMGIERTLIGHGRRPTPYRHAIGHP